MPSFISHPSASTELPHPPARIPRRLYLAALGLFLTGFALLPADVAISRTLFADGDAALFHLPGDLRRLISLSEFFAHGAGMALILIAVLVLDPRGRRPVARIAAAAFGAGLVANLFKLSVLRTRPLASDLAATTWDTFQGWLPGSVEHWGQSTPSGHSAQVAALAAALAWRYPRGRWLFACYACLAILQRITSGAHFLSDTLWGAGLGLAFAGLCLDSRLLGRVFDRFERRGSSLPPSDSAASRPSPSTASTSQAA